MSGFSAEWLDLRESADHAARDAGLLAAAREILKSSDRPLAVDLGCGTGSTVRAFADPAIRWRLVDADPDLLAEAAGRIPGAETFCLDLNLFVRDPRLEGAGLVTASALLDLVSEQWSEALADLLAEARLPLYAALTYDGAMHFEPAHPLDHAVRAAFDRHQRRDKGFGPALGSGAATRVPELLAQAGFEIRAAPSPWRLGKRDTALASALIKGIAAAALEEGSLPPAEIGDWQERRLAGRQAGAIAVGHLDILALPPR